VANCDPGTREYPDLERSFRALERSIGLRVRDVACAGAPIALACGELGRSGMPQVAIAAGVHGDEPAAPWAVISALEAGLLDARFAYRIWPCTNPSGYVAGTRSNGESVDVNRSFSDAGSTPESRAIIGANRERRFVLSIDVHEDCDAEGFYCYVAGPQAAELGGTISHAVTEAGFHLQDFAGFDFGEPAGTNPHRRCADGVVIMDAHEARYFDGLSYNLYMAERTADHVVTLETPRERPWDERIAMHRIAIVAALDYVATALSRATNGTI
jgi:murein peptide amidase A